MLEDLKKLKEENPKEYKAKMTLVSWLAFILLILIVGLCLYYYVR